MCFPFEFFWTKAHSIWKIIISKAPVWESVLTLKNISKYCLRGRSREGSDQGSEYACLGNRELPDNHKQEGKATP